MKINWDAAETDPKAIVYNVFYRQSNDTAFTFLKQTLRNSVVSKNFDLVFNPVDLMVVGVTANGE